MKKLKSYEVHIPMPYCEVYIVQAESIKHAKQMLDDKTISDNFECVGTISSRKKKITKLRS